VRNTAASAWPDGKVEQLRAKVETKRFTTIRRGLYAGAAVVLTMIAFSMVVIMLEQLRERRRLLAVLVALGTRRSTLAWSALLQTMVAVSVGIALAILIGVGLGALLLRTTGSTFRLDWKSIGGMTAAGAGLILLVTALSLPVLWRLTRPGGEPVPAGQRRRRGVQPALGRTPRRRPALRRRRS
jgi:ABC-type antimicrobial peptide transport system permease subunit